MGSTQCRDTKESRDSPGCTDLEQQTEMSPLWWCSGARGLQPWNPGASCALGDSGGSQAWPAGQGRHEHQVPREGATSRRLRKGPVSGRPPCAQMENEKQAAGVLCPGSLSGQPRAAALQDWEPKEAAELQQTLPGPLGLTLMQQLLPSPPL